MHQGDSYLSEGHIDASLEGHMHGYPFGGHKTHQGQSHGNLLEGCTLRHTKVMVICLKGIQTYQGHGYLFEGHTDTPRSWLSV